MGHSSRTLRIVYSHCWSAPQGLLCLSVSTNVNASISNVYNSFPPQGVPLFRTRVLYVPQRPSMLPGSPKDFLASITSLESHKTTILTKDRDTDRSPQNILGRAIQISQDWHIDPQLWEREWSNLSGGEAQRLALAIAVSLDTAEVILLDGTPFIFAHVMAQRH